MKKTKRLIIWSIIAALALIMLIAMLFSNEIHWNESIAYIMILVALGGIYELWHWLKTHNKTYRLAFGIGLIGVFLIFWANGAIGIIGSEDNPANLMYGAIFVAGLIGSIISRLKPRGMTYTLCIMAIIQILIPIFALLIWPAQASWGDAGVIGVFIFNSIFAMVFIISALLFRRSIVH